MLTYKKDCFALKQKPVPLKTFRAQITRGLGQTSKAKRGRRSLQNEYNAQEIRIPIVPKPDSRGCYWIISDSHCTGDKRWVPYATPESKRQSKKWHHVHSPTKPIQFKVAEPARKLKATVFWDQQRIPNHSPTGNTSLKALVNAVIIPPVVDELTDEEDANVNLLQGENTAQDVAGCHCIPTPRRDHPTTARHGDFWLLGFPPGPLRPSLANLAIPDSSGMSILMPSLVRTPGQRGARAKKYYNDGRDGYGADQTIAMWNEALQHCDAEFWNHCENHTENIIKDWHEPEKILKVTVNQIIINITNDNSDPDCNKSDSD
ncbi:hypothetical protein ILUMI_20504 [Ignelater luminosus]|uniref:Uncharacterized protein n=1 Tax=Ignelater luminosus TaxID=2038154 RepID=A0A8K0CE51_IGNLU|nr:hypothetical protein ILUMI_20504 [Ignelater luminosus]